MPQLPKTTAFTTHSASSSKFFLTLLRAIADRNSVFIAGQVLKKSLSTFSNKVDGQQALSEKKAKLIYAALDAHPESYKVVPVKSVRSRMNICFRVTHVRFPVFNQLPAF
jgi:hypothetical protein